MKQCLVLFLFLITIKMGYGQESWRKEMIKLPPSICYASHEIHKSFVKPPVLLKAGSTKKATIIVNYVGFPDSAKLAFQYAVDIWQDLIYSSVPIHIRAFWESLDTDILGSCGPSDYVPNFNSTQIWNCYYPIALVEKMLGQEVNSPTDYEIEASFNKDFTNWYFGVDGNTPTNKYDFASTVLHELTHGLGFDGFFYSDSRGRGGYGGIDGYSAAFDQYVINKNRNSLVDTKLFTNPSIVLHQELTSGWLNFDSKLTDDALPRLYAPSTWTEGSSVYHLNDASYPPGDVNSLMTHAMAMGEANHNPGPKTLAIMGDIGWKSISIKHKPLKDIEVVDTPIDFNAQIESDYDLDLTKLYLIYSSDKFLNADSILLKPTSTPDVFNAKLLPGHDGEIQYYFSAKDIKQRTFVFPSNSPARYLSFKIGIDKTAPVITHDPVKYMLTDKLTAQINAVVTDNIGVKSVRMEYFVNSGPTKSLVLDNSPSTDEYSCNLTFLQGEVADGDQVSYRIVATDISSQSNIGYLPSTGYFTFKIQNDKELPVISHNPVKFLLSTNPSTKISAVVTDNLGVKSVNVEYFINGGFIKELALNKDSADHYSGILDFPKGSVKGGDVISYRIVATDISSQNNMGRFPLSGYNTFKIEGIQDPVARYVTNFDVVNQDFIGSDFTISTPTGFDSKALNSAHPYLSPDTDNTEFNFITILRYPITLNTKGKMTFDEIVLVEPGDAGTKFGDENFWDYVIVEGSKDGGMTWQPFTDGYDSNLQNSWLTLWSSSMAGNNSTAVPTKDLFVKHPAINLIANGNFKAGDTVLIRFRLFSDPYSHGWGWIVDNLAVQDWETVVNPILISSGEIRCFPNPATNQLNIQIDTKNDIQNLILKAYNSSGKLVYNQYFPVRSNIFQTTIDVRSFVAGLYLFTLEPEKGQVITRKIVIR